MSKRNLGSMQTINQTTTRDFIHLNCGVVVKWDGSVPTSVITG
jgi:hypothetical protein